MELTRSDLVRPELYPRFTLLGQAYGSVVLTYEALLQMVPEVGARRRLGWRGSLHTTHTWMRMALHGIYRRTIFTQSQCVTHGRVG